MIRTVAVLTLLSACGPDETISGYADVDTVWRLTELNGAAYPAVTVLRFPEEGVVLGEGPCNAFTAKQGVPMPWIEITDLTPTRRACPDIAAEGAFLDGLRSATLAEVGPNVLLLTNGDGLEMVFASAATSDDPA